MFCAVYSSFLITPSLNGLVSKAGFNGGERRVDGYVLLRQLRVRGLTMFTTMMMKYKTFVVIANLRKKLK